MAYSFVLSNDLEEKLLKIKKKNSVLFHRMRKKIEEILEHPEHYKPLGNDMKGMRRVHLDPFVLTFTVIENENIVKFLDVDHHDKIYGR